MLIFCLTNLWYCSVITQDQADSGTQLHKNFSIEGTCNGGTCLRYCTFHNGPLISCPPQPQWRVVFFGYVIYSHELRALCHSIWCRDLRLMTKASILSLLGMYESFLDTNCSRTKYSLHFQALHCVRHEQFESKQSSDLFES